MKKTGKKERHYKIVDVSYLGDQGFCDVLEKLREDGWEFAGVFQYNRYQVDGSGGERPCDIAEKIIVRRVKSA